MVGLQTFWNQNNIRIQLFNSEKRNEFELGFDYGVNNPVPLYFIFGESNQILLSCTPCGKTVFVGSDFAELAENEVLYRNLRLLHLKDYCITVGVDVRDRKYWEYISTGDILLASTYLASLKNIEINAAKEMVMGDSPIMGMSVIIPEYDIKQINIVERQIVADLKNKMIQLFDNISTIQGKLSDLERENFLLKKLNSGVVELRLKKQISSLNEELEKLKAELKMLKLKKTTISNIASNVDIAIDPWKIIKCSPSTDKKVIKSNITAALKKYHPDKFAEAGEEIQLLSTKITQEILDLKEKFG